MIQLGDRVRDRITGFEGVVIGITDYLYGCRRPIVQPQGMHEGKPKEAQSFDEPQLALVEAGSFKVTAQEPAEKTGGPRPTPSRGRAVSR